jgi:hypothetical protein
MTKGTGFSFLNENLSHHMNQFFIFQDLLDNMGMGFPIIFTIGEAAFSAHFSTP